MMTRPLTPEPQELLAQFRRGIEATPGVCGGDPRVSGTRLPIWTLEQGRRLGLSEAEILRAYPGLSAADLVNAWAYVASHREEIDRQILENEDD